MEKYHGRGIVYDLESQSFAFGSKSNRAQTRMELILAVDERRANIYESVLQDKKGVGEIVRQNAGDFLIPPGSVDHLKGVGYSEARDIQALNSADGCLVYVVQFMLPGQDAPNHHLVLADNLGDVNNFEQLMKITRKGSDFATWQVGEAHLASGITDFLGRKELYNKSSFKFF